MAKRLAPYNKLKDQAAARDRELLERSPAFLKAEAELKAVQKAVEDRKAQLATEFGATPDVVKMKADIDAMRKELSTMRDAVRKSGDASIKTDEQKDLEAKVRRLDAKVGSVESKLQSQREQFVAKALGAMPKKIGEAEAALAKASDEAMEPYWPEKVCSQDFQYSGFRGYYNTAYPHYLESHVRAMIGAGEMRENLDILIALHKSFIDEKNWHTTVDWEWRMQEEIDSRIKDLPLMQKWLVRVRGK